MMEQDRFKRLIMSNKPVSDGTDVALLCADSGNNVIVRMKYESVYDPTFTLDVEKTQEQIKHLAETINNLVDAATEVFADRWTIRQANNSVIVNVPQIVRYQDIVDDINLTDSAANLKPNLSKESFLPSFTHAETLKLAEDLRNRTVDTTSNLPTDYNPVILANKVKITIGGKTYKLTINGYSMTDKIYTTYAGEDIVGNEHKLIFYNAQRVAESTDREEQKKDKQNYQKKIDLSDVKNIRKAFELIVHDSIGLGTASDLKKYLKIKGVFDLSGNPTIADNNITLRLKRLYSNSMITIGELTVDGDASVRLVTVELRKGDNCADENENLPKEQKSRICAGTYTFTLNTASSTIAPQHRYKSLRLNTLKTATGGQRDGILIHAGWNYNFTEGCILTLNHNDIQAVADNPQNYLNKLTGKISQISEDQFTKNTIITFVDKQPLLIDNQEISFTGFTGDTSYNGTFIIKKLSDHSILINHPFHKEAIATAASFSTEGNAVSRINWDNSAPTTMSLYEYVEKHVPNGTVKGRIVITEDTEVINVPQNIVPQNIIDVVMKWADFTQWTNNQPNN